MKRIDSRIGFQKAETRGREKGAGDCLWDEQRYLHRLAEGWRQRVVWLRDAEPKSYSNACPTYSKLLHSCEWG